MHRIASTRLAASAMNLARHACRDGLEWTRASCAAREMYRRLRDELQSRGYWYSPA